MNYEHVRVMVDDDPACGFPSSIMKIYSEIQHATGDVQITDVQDRLQLCNILARCTSCAMHCNRLDS